MTKVEDLSNKLASEIIQLENKDTHLMTKVNSLTKKDLALETKLTELESQFDELNAKVKLYTFDLAFSLKLHN